MQPPAHACPISCSCGTIGPPSQEPLLPPTARTLSQALTTDLPTQAFGPCCNSSRLRGSDCREAVGTANQPMHPQDWPQHGGNDHHHNTDSPTGVRPLLQQQQAQEELLMGQKKENERVGRTQKGHKRGSRQTGQGHKQQARREKERKQRFVYGTQEIHKTRARV